jgi:hypothetical protein|uniref:Uncharacterized protein n=1 Tax=Zea mays TaxID=4577 RepID=A0A804R5Z9_MAIZE
MVPVCGIRAAYASASRSSVPPRKWSIARWSRHIADGDGGRDGGGGAIASVGGKMRGVWLSFEYGLGREEAVS